MTIFETHAHLDFGQFDPDRDAVFERARAAGVARIVNIALSPDVVPKTLALTERPGVYAAIGIHPHEAGRFRGEALEAALERLAGWLDHPRVVALGEMGLDYYRDYAPAAAQRAVFDGQLQLANRARLPVIIHSRAADRDVLEQLRAYHGGPVILHCFAGEPETARVAAARGYYIGVGGVLTYPNAGALRAAVAGYPRERVVVETDCPFLAPQPRRGKRNEPAYLTWVIEALAALWRVEPQEAAAITYANACRVFGVDADPVGDDAGGAAHA